MSGRWSASEHRYLIVLVQLVDLFHEDNFSGRYGKTCIEITAVCSIDSLTTVGDSNGGMHGSDAVVGRVGG